MRIAVLGAGGRTGVHLVKRALAAGHEVVAFARTPAKLGMNHERVRILTVDFTAPEAESILAQGLSGVDAAVSVLGPEARGRPGVMAVAAERVIAAAKKAGVRRVVWMTGAGVKLAGDSPSFIRSIVRGIIKLAAGTVLADSEMAAHAIVDSGLDWTLARAPMLNDEPPSGRLSASTIPPKPAALSRDEIAGFLLECAEKGLWSKAAPFLSLESAG